MKILYTNKYVEIKACKEKKFLDIKQKKKIEDPKELDRLSHNIKYFTDLTKYDTILYSMGDTDFSREFNLFQDYYFSEAHQSGMKNLLLIVDDDEYRRIFKQELQDFNLHSQLHIEFFKDNYSATQWITHKPKEILAH